MTNEKVNKVVLRLFFYTWIASPLTLIYLNYKGLWMWTPFGKIVHDSMLIGDIFASCSWLFVFYALPFILGWVLKPFWEIRE